MKIATSVLELSNGEQMVVSTSHRADEWGTIVAACQWLKNPSPTALALAKQDTRRKVGEKLR